MKALPRCWPVAQRDGRRDHPPGSGWGRPLPEGLDDKELEGQVWRRLCQVTGLWGPGEEMPVYLRCSLPSSVQSSGPQSLLPCCPTWGSAYVVQTWTLSLGEGRGPIPGHEAQRSCPSASCWDSAVPETQLPLPGPHVLPRPCRSDLVPVWGGPGRGMPTQPGLREPGPGHTGEGLVSLHVAAVASTITPASCSGAWVCQRRGRRRAMEGREEGVSGLLVKRKWHRP